MKGRRSFWKPQEGCGLGGGGWRSPKSTPELAGRQWLIGVNLQGLVGMKLAGGRLSRIVRRGRRGKAWGGRPAALRLLQSQGAPFTAGPRALSPRGSGSSAQSSRPVWCPQELAVQGDPW